MSTDPFPPSVVLEIVRSPGFSRDTRQELYKCSDIVVLDGFGREERQTPPISRPCYPKDLLQINRQR